MKKVKIELPFSRKKEIRRMHGKLERESYPRIQMFFLVLITGGAAFLSSYVLLHLGITSMWIRYLIVCLVAYIVFLLLLWLWLRNRMEDIGDIGDIASNIPEMNINSPNMEFLGGGGELGGGGASGSFDESPPFTIGLVGEGENPVVEALGAAGEAEEFALPLIVLILIVTIVLSSVFVIYTAPMLFAELLVDSLLAASLYQKLRKVETQHWLTTAIHKTIIPFLITTVVSVSAGFALQLYAPMANSLGEVLHLINQMP